MTSPTTPADAQFEAVLNEKCDQLSRELVASRKFTEAEARLFTHVARGSGTWAREWERKAALESEPVRGLPPGAFTQSGGGYAGPDEPERRDGCSVAFTCEGGIWECQRADMLAELATLKAENTKLRERIKELEDGHE